MNTLNFNIIDSVSLGRSQKGQDSFIQYAYEMIGTTNKYYVEFGACDGYNMCNTAYLRESKGWSGLLLEGDPNVREDPSINLHNRWIDKDNICGIFEEFQVPKDLDFLCIDIDGMDFWITKAILEGGYRPRVVMVETNVRFDPYDSKTLKYNPQWVWDGGNWCGASPYAFKKMFNALGYEPTWVHIDDMIAIRKDILDDNQLQPLEWDTIYPHSLKEIYAGHISRDGKQTFELNEEEWMNI